MNNDSCERKVNYKVKIGEGEGGSEKKEGT